MQYRDGDGAGSGQTARLLNRFLYGDVVDQVLADEQYAVNTGPSVFATTAGATSGNTLWTLSDHLGSVRDVVDNNGVIRQHVVFDSFGRRLSETDVNGAIDELFGFAGRDWDADTNLQYNRARWYDSDTGRWLSTNPISFAAGDINLYRSIGNRITAFIDPIDNEKVSAIHGTTPTN